MEEVFANSGFHHIAEIICKNLEPDSYQKLVSTCTTMQNFSTIISDRWLKNCQAKGFCLDSKWKKALKGLQLPKYKWNLGIIFHRINYECATNHPLEIIAKCGQSQVIKWLFGCTYKSDIIPTYYRFYKNVLESLLGEFEKIQTFKAFSEVLKSFLTHKKWLVKELIESASKKGSIEIKKHLELLLNEPNSLGHTPMHTYAYYGNIQQNIEIVKFAAPICLSPNHQDNFGTTPIHIALEKGHLEIVKALIPKWDNKQAKNQENKTAFQIAKEKGYHEIMELMIQNTLE